MRLFDAIPGRQGEEVEFDIYECLGVYGKLPFVLVSGAIAAMMVVYLPGIIRMVYGVVYTGLARVFALITGSELYDTYYFSLTVDIKHLISYTRDALLYLAVAALYGIILAFLRYLYGHHTPPVRHRFKYHARSPLSEWFLKWNYHSSFTFVTAPLFLAYFLYQTKDTQGRIYWFLSLFLVIGPVVNFFWKWFHNWLMFDGGSLASKTLISEALEAYLDRELAGEIPELKVDFNAKDGHTRISGDLTPEQMTEVKLTLGLIPQVTLILSDSDKPNPYEDRRSPAGNSGEP